MLFTDIINAISGLIAKTSAWLYEIQNTQRTAGSSNYVLLIFAVSIISAGLFFEWVTANEQRKKKFFQWRESQPWLRHVFNSGHSTLARTLDLAAISLPTITRHTRISDHGLRESEVRARLAAGNRNVTHVRTSRSYRHIFISNFFTRFNALLGAMYVLILLVGAPQDSLFGLILVLNTIIGIVQELRAKWALDKLALVSVVSSRVVRDGKIAVIPANDIVVDDAIVLRSGDQVPVDGIILDSSNAEINESMVTGESEPVIKHSGDSLYSGSIVVAGNCRMQAVYIGEQAYVRRLTNAARRFALSKSELRTGINQILRYVTWLLIPTALLLFASQILYLQQGWKEALSASAGGVVNMVPDGLVLLTSVVMALAIIRLSQKRVLIQELAAVEMLARIDVLCLDKTGTLTEGVMAVEKTIPLDQEDSFYRTLKIDPKVVLGVFAHAQEKTSTLTAIGRRFPHSESNVLTVTENIPFSSARKWSALTFEKHGTWILGAAEMILPKKTFEQLEKTSQLGTLSNSGKRVLLLTYTAEPIHHTGERQLFSVPNSHPVLLVVLQEQLRSGVGKTLEYFKKQGIALKIISGDSPQTVAAVARNAGIDVNHVQNGLALPHTIDELAPVINRHQVFGRILPEQKKAMIRALQKQGHVVAMIGDGVNDVLAIKEADFGIAMGAGTDSSRAIAQLVLLDNNFTVLPDVIAEGRRIIGNTERTANLFITKTAYVIIMSLAVGIALVPFPFLPRHLTLIGTFTVGIPALFLSFAKNTSHARPGFVKRVFQFSLPSGALIAALTLASYAISRQLVPGNIELARTNATFTLFGCGLVMLILLAKPKTCLHKIFIVSLVLCMSLILIIPQLRELFGLQLLPFGIWIILSGVVGICAYGLIQLKKRSFDFSS